MKIGIEGQRLFRKKKHGMDMVALELIRNLQHIDTENDPYQGDRDIDRPFQFRILFTGSITE